MPAAAAVLSELDETLPPCRDRMEDAPSQASERAPCPPPVRSGVADPRWVFNPWIPRWRRFARSSPSEKGAPSSASAAAFATAEEEEEAPSPSPSSSTSPQSPPPRRQRPTPRYRSRDLGTGAFTALAADLLCGLLEADPARRLTAAEALRHAYFVGEAAGEAGSEEEWWREAGGGSAGPGEEEEEAPAAEEEAPPAEEAR